MREHGFSEGMFLSHGGRKTMVTHFATEGKLQNLGEELERIKAFVEAAAREGVVAHEVERRVWTDLLALGRQLLGEFFRLAGDGDLGETVELPDGRVFNRLDDLHPRTYRSIFGAFELLRTAYGTREGQKIELAPLDARLELPESDYSYVLQDWSQALSTDHAFAKTAEMLTRILKLSVPVDSLERIGRQMARSVESFRNSQEAPKPEEEGEILVVTADNKGIPMRRPANQRPAGCRRKKGEKANKKQMATVGCVHTVDPNVRTPEDVVAALFREPHEPREPEPHARQKRVWSSLSYARDGRQVDSEEEVLTWMNREVTRRRRDGQTLVYLSDGERRLKTDCEKYLPGNMVWILDILHVSEKVWNAAYLFHREASDEAAAFVRERLLGILRGQAGYVVGGLRQMATKRGLKGAKLKRLNAICNYLENNRFRMDYDQYLAAGYPIASGVIEGACRYFVKDRMERAGMRWTVAGAQAMLDLRSTYINGQWDEFQTYHINAERKRLYPHRALTQQHIRVVA
jgi:hypothetical protein